MKRFTITTLAALGIIAGTVPVARAADTTCTTIISSGTTINGNLVVPAGATCVLTTFVTVTGNVQVGTGASLAVVAPNSGNMVKIGGNVQADQCKLVRLTMQGLGAAISVGGNVQIQNCTGGSAYDAGAGEPSRSAEISRAITIPRGALLMLARSAAMCRSTTIPGAPW